ncbi:MAG: hypothetical protein F4Y63_06295 [Chloroflexi bacterium]|nr:hypothetical protein [Chloroflexota bacterium]MYK60460.1 hypothetical protein [Chloroflexota bacterium]
MPARDRLPKYPRRASSRDLVKEPYGIRRAASEGRREGRDNPTVYVLFIHGKSSQPVSSPTTMNPQAAKTKAAELAMTILSLRVPVTHRRFLSLFLESPPKHHGAKDEHHWREQDQKDGGQFFPRDDSDQPSMGNH